MAFFDPNSVLGKLLSPEVALPMASALMGQQGNGQNFANAFGAAGPALAQQKQLTAQTAQSNKTLEFLRKNSPDLAAQVDAGMPVTEAWQVYNAQRNQKPADPYKEVGGQLYDTRDGSWKAPPGTGDDYSARRKAAAEMGLKPDDPRYQSFVLTNKFPREDSQELTATDKKAIWAAEDEIPVLDNTITSLNRAKELNTKTYTGTGASTAGWLGTSMPGGSYIFDQDTAKATSEFGKIMSMEAIQSMAQTLKGATTDAELARFVDILADPSTPPDIRGRTIDRMLTLAERVKQVKQQRINSISGRSAPDAGATGGATADPLGIR